MTLELPALLPPAWRAALEPHLDPAATAALGEFVAAEYATQHRLPAARRPVRRVPALSAAAGAGC